MKEKRIIEINELLNKADIPLLDLIQKILEKRVPKIKEDYPTSA